MATSRRKTRRSPPLRRDLWLELGSPCIADALRNLGRHFQTMDSGLRAVHPGMGLSGPAFTVRCYPGATWAMERALELAPRGSVLVVDGGGMPDVILMGGLMSTRATERGLAGAVVDGAVRDVRQIAAAGLPVFSRHVSPRAGTFAEIGEWQTTVCCGRIPVRPGDLIVGDSSGLVVVPAEEIDRTAAEAQRIAEREGRIEALLRRGLSLGDAVTASDIPGAHVSQTGNGDGRTETAPKPRPASGRLVLPAASDAKKQRSATARQS